MSDQVILQNLSFAEQRRRRRDPFGWILATMALSLLIGIPVLWVTLVMGEPISIRIVFGTLVVVMALASVAAVMVAVGKGLVKHSLRDLFSLTLAAAIGCAMVVYGDVLVRAGLWLALISVLTFWWTNRAPGEAPSTYLLRLCGHFLLIALLVTVVLGGAWTALSMIVHGRGR